MSALGSGEESPTSALFYDSIEELEDSVNSSFMELDELRSKLNRYYKKIDEITGKHRAYNDKLQQLRSHFESDFADSHSDDGTPNDVLNKIELNEEKHIVAARLDKMNGDISELAKCRQKIGSLFLRGIVGHINLRLWNDNARLELKKEYYQFKWKTNIIFMILPILQLIWSRFISANGEFSWVIHQYHHGWLLYMYLSLSIREYILRLNGSRIHIWWIYHHHISSFLSFVSILLMRSAYDRFQFIFDFSIFLYILIGASQIWLNHYQHRRHYARTALGKVGDFDVSTGETLSERTHWRNWETTLLRVWCYILYILEISTGIAILVYVFFVDYQTNQRTFDLCQFECYSCGLCFISLGFGNALALYNGSGGETRLNRIPSRLQLAPSRQRLSALKESPFLAPLRTEPPPNHSNKSD